MHFSINNFITRLYKQIMFKEIISGFSKFFTRDKVIIFVALIILAYALTYYSNSKSIVSDNMEDGSKGDEKKVEAPAAQPAPSQTGGYSPQAVANPADLLPADENSQWSALNPSAMNRGSILVPDNLDAGYHIGQISQVLRNANQQLRADPVIPKVDVGPWMQSTIEADPTRRPCDLA